MQALHRKLFRDLVHMRGQVLAVAAVVACGIASFVILRSALDSLESELQIYYTKYNFADVFVSLKEAPEYVSDRIAAIAGITEVSTRLVFDVSLKVPGLKDAAVGHFVSLPFYGKPNINGVFIREGRYIDSSRDDEAVVSETFLKANKLEIGDSVSAILNGRLQVFRIVGSGLSPEFLYEAQGGAAIFPDPKHFGVFWVSRKGLEHAFDLTGSFNDVSIRVSPRAQIPDIISSLDRLLKPYGSIGAYGRSEQVSEQFIVSEMQGLKSMSSALPFFFLGIAAFLLHIVLGRLIATEREQIAVLKAFGYTNYRIAWHYLEFAFATIFVGALFGLALGIYGGIAIVKVYLTYFHFPELQFHLAPSLFFFAFFVTLLAATVGALKAVRSAIKLPPAEAMRPEAPATYKRGLLERIGLQRLLSVSGRMVVRELERKPTKAILSMLTIAFAVSLLVTGLSLTEGINHIIALEFYAARHDDITVGFHVPRPEGVKYDLSRIPGVMEVECARMLPVDLSYRSHKKRIAIEALDRSGILRQLVDMKGIRHPLPVRGLALSSFLAAELGASIGDTLTVALLEGHQRQRQMVLSDTIDDMVGINAYIALDNVEQLTAQDMDYSVARLAVDPNLRELTQAEIKNLPSVSSVTLRTAAVESYESSVSGSLNFESVIFILLAGVLAFGVIYNSGRITLSEQGREFASLRVLGFTKREVAMILIAHQAAIVLVGIPLGFLLGYGLYASILGGFDTELFRIPLTFSVRSLGYATIVVLASAMISNIFVTRRIYHLDIIEVLKTRE